MTLLVVGLLVHAARWHLSPRWLLIDLAYRRRPYCWRIDARHGWLAHRACRRLPCVIDLRDLPEPEDFELALQRLLERDPAEGRTERWR